MRYLTGHPLVATLALALAVGACGSGEEGDCDPIAATLVERIEVSPASSTLTPGQAATLTARAFSCSGPLSPVTFTWESANAAIAAVSAAGVVTGVSTGGPVQVIARAQGKQGTSSVTVGIVPVASVTVTPDVAALGVGRTAQLTAHAFDASGSEIEGRTATWSSENDAVATVNASGVVTGVAAGGPVAITATVDGVAGSSQVTVSLVPVASITVTPETSTIASGATVQLTATTRDDQGNILAGRAVAWSSGNSTVAPVSATGLVTGERVGGPVTITATSEGQAGTAQVTVTVGPPTRLVYIQQPTSVQAGSAIAPAIVVEVQDEGGNRVTGFGGVVVLGIAANPGGSTLGGTTSVSAASGRATFSSVTLNRPGAGYTLLASSSGLSGVASNTFTVTHGNPNHLVFLAQPSDIRAGEAITPPVQVEVRDAQGNRATSFTSAVTVAIESNPGGATLGGTTTVAAVAGVAQFADLTLDRPATGYTLRTGTATLAAVVSTGFSVAPGAATSIGIVESPVGSVTSGQGFTVSVEALDASGSRATSQVGTVSLSLGNGAPGAVLSGTTTRAFEGGLATFSGLSVDLASEGYTILATSDGLPNVATPTFDVLPGPASRMEFVAPVNDIEEREAFNPPVQVVLRDAGGNVASGAAGVVTFELRRTNCTVTSCNQMPQSGTFFVVAGTTTTLGTTRQVTIVEGLATLDRSVSVTTDRDLRIRALYPPLLAISNTFEVSED